MHGVALTSLWIAAARAVETEREGPLFRDPFARRLAGDEGFALLATLEAAAKTRPPSLEVRTRFLDDELAAAVASGLRQLVVLAAGMDSRAYRLDWPPGTILFEIDQPHVLAYKARILDGESPRCDRRSIPLDLRHDWPSALLAAGFDPTHPTVWLVEGLVYYLEESQALALFARITDLAAPRSVLLFDLIGRSVLQSPYMKPMLDFVASLGAPWTFGTDEPEALLAPFGWHVDATDFAVAGHRYNRWPFPVLPRGTPGKPQSFLVKALK